MTEVGLKLQYDKHRHSLKPCSGCGKPLRHDAKLCWNCFVKKKRGQPRQVPPGYVLVSCDGCRATFSTKEDWDEGLRVGRGLPREKPTRFYCTPACMPWGRNR